MPAQPPPAEVRQALIDAPPPQPPSILTRELPLGREALDRSTRVRPTEIKPSFRIARPLPESDPGTTQARSADRAAVAEPETRPLPRVVRVAPVWRRLCAWLVDSALLLLIFWGFLLMASGLVHRGSPPSRQAGLDWLTETLLAYASVWVPALALFSLITVGYLALFTALGGQTPGKRLLRLQVVDASGAEPGIFRSALRALLALGSGLMVLMGFLLVLFDRRRQALHDKLAHTYVICQS
jgi:uncharacterized RDD family membrane protein YckC